MKTHPHSSYLAFLILIAPVLSRADGDQSSVDEPRYDHHVPMRVQDGQANVDPVTKKEPPHLLINPDCLAAFYDFSDYDPDVGSVRDQSGNGYTLSAVDVHAGIADGISGKGIMLNGGYFQAAGNPLEGADHFTISVWFKTAEPMNNYKLLSAAVWSGGNNASGWNIGTHYSEFWADNQEGSLRGEPGWERSIAFQKDAWNHLVVTYDGAFVREFINGQPSAKIIGTSRRVGNGVPMVVGAWMGGFRFQGIMDEVRIYRRSLSEQEVQAMYRAAFPVRRSE